MAYTIDVLILFADQDNHLTETERGWIEDFKRFLEGMLKQVLGEIPNILLKSEHDAVSGANLKEVAVLLPILSPSFIASGECLDTLEEFLVSGKNAEKRVFKVLKRPLETSDQPTKLRGLIGYDLFSLNIETDEVQDYTNFFTTEAERDFWMRLVDLAYDINERLIEIKFTDKKSEHHKDIGRKSIFLAETGHDLSIQRNIIKRELQRYGYRILPDHTLPGEAAKLREVVQAEVEEASLSIHLIGGSYGDIPEGSDKSVVDIQNEIAADKSARIQNKSEFARLVWISPELENASEKQQAFIENIQRDLSSAEAAEILQTPLEDFKNIIREELIEVRLDKKLLHGELAEAESPQVYLLYDQVDQKEANQVKKALEKGGFKVLIPSFKGELLTLRQFHIENLRQLDAAVIIQKNVNDQWVNMKALDLLKAPGFGRRKPIRKKIIVSYQKNLSTLQKYKDQEFSVVDGNTKSNLESEINALVEDMKELTL
ncbi:MAG: DUF4062 domain-containing protein [Bacteroidota bacterium]